MTVESITGGAAAQVIPPAHKLRELVRECIERHVDKQQLELLRVAEKSERELLAKWAAIHGGGTAS